MAAINSPLSRYPEAVHHILRRQHRVIARAQARNAGLSRGVTDNLIRGKKWRIIYPGIYTDTTPLTDDARIWAAYLTAGPGAIIAGEAALYCEGLAEKAPVVIDIYVPDQRNHRPKRGIHFRRIRNLSRVTYYRKHGLYVTRTARSCLDMARWGDDNDYMEVALRRRAATTEEFQRTLRHMDNLRGYARARRHIDEIMTNPWSVPERQLHAHLKTAGISGWVANERVVTALGVFKPDVRFDEVKLAVEIEGRRYHAEAADRDAFEKGARRTQALIDDGWYVLKFTATQIMNDPAKVIGTIRTVIAQLSALRPTTIGPDPESGDIAGPKVRAALPEAQPQDQLRQAPARHSELSA